MDFFAEEFVISKTATREAYEELCSLMRQWAELCKLEPHKAEIYLQDLKKEKSKVLSKLLKKSLLLSDQIPA